MSRNAVDRDLALRRLLVAQATRTPRSVPWPAVVGTVAVVALLGGVAIGAAAFRGSDVTRPAVSEPAPGGLPPFVSEDSVVVGTPVVLAATEMVAYEMGPPRGAASGLAIWVRCDEGATFGVELDGRAEVGGDCDETGGGGYVRYDRHGPNVVTVTPSAPMTVWIAWVRRGNDTSAGAESEAALADGEVTAAEYRAGFDRFVACMAEWGVTVSADFASEGRIFYSLPGDDRIRGAEHVCYGTEFRDLDIAWQLAHPQRSEAATLALVDGVTREEYVASFDRWAECLADLGASVHVADPDSEVFDYAVDAGFAPSNAVSLCYRMEFFDVEMAWKADHSF